MPASEPSRLPSALDSVERIATRLDGRRAAVFLDFDGTLTPIVSHPDDADLSSAMRSVLGRLASVCPVAVVSGRDLEDVKRRVGIDALFYAGSHGLDISGPGGLRFEPARAKASLPELDEAERILENRLGGVDGVLLERKRFGLAVHFRNAAPATVPEVKSAIDEVHRASPGLVPRPGRKVVELRPAVDWDKGRAVLWLLKTLPPGPGDVLPFYIGDDTTDEDGFRALGGRGIGIVVGLPPRTTHATYRLEDPSGVEAFLHRLTCLVESTR